MTTLDFKNAAAASRSAGWSSLFQTYLQSLVLRDRTLSYDQENLIVYTGGGHQYRCEGQYSDLSRPSIIFCGEGTQSSVMASFIGQGLLSAYVFSSPNTTLFKKQFLAALKYVDTRCGVMILTFDAGIDRYDGLSYEGDLDAAVAEAKVKDPCLVIAQLRVNNLRLGKTDLDQHFGLFYQADIVTRLVLIVKICAACAQRGFWLEQVAMLGGLVMKNTVSASLGLRRMDDTDQLRLRADPIPPETIQQTLKRILDPDLRPHEFVQVKSNESVLVVRCNNTDDFDSSLADSITKEVVQQLKKDWNIHPVRTYSIHLLHQAQCPQPGSFSVSILNVVNTDIGGPGMPELLDDRVAGPSGWRTWAHCQQPTQPLGLSRRPCSLNFIRGVWAAAVKSGLQGLLEAGSVPPPGREHGTEICVRSSDLEDRLVCEICHVAREILVLNSKTEWLSKTETTILTVLEDVTTGLLFMSTSFGSICLIFLTALLNSFESQAETADELNLGVWIYALEEALEITQGYVKADCNEFSHTMGSPQNIPNTSKCLRPVYFLDMDLLQEAVKTLHSTGKIWKMVDSAEETSRLLSKFDHLRIWPAFFRGLANYLEPRSEQATDDDLKAETKEETLMNIAKEQRELAAGGEVDASPAKPASDDLGSVKESELSAPKPHQSHGNELRDTEATNESDSILQTEPDRSTIPKPSTAELSILGSIGAALGFRSHNSTSSISPGDTLKSVPPTSTRTDAEQPTQLVEHEAASKPMDISEGPLELSVRPKEAIPRPGASHADEGSLADVIREQVQSLERRRAEETEKEEVGASTSMRGETEKMEGQERGDEDEDYEFV